MQLSQKHVRFLRQRAHRLKPVVSMGKGGLSAGVIAEIDQALACHELIKVKLAGADKAERSQLAAEIESQTDASRIQIIGNMLSIYRPPRGRKPRLILP